MIGRTRISGRLCGGLWTEGVPDPQRMTLNLPDWMVERIVAILEAHEYTGAAEIVETIKEQTRETN